MARLRHLAVSLLVFLFLAAILTTAGSQPDMAEEEAGFNDPYSDMEPYEEGGFDFDVDGMMQGYGQYEGIGPGEDFGDDEDKYGSEGGEDEEDEDAHCEGGGALKYEEGDGEGEGEDMWGDDNESEYEGGWDGEEGEEVRALRCVVLQC